jgi:RND family efflux transporter MFP subunit
MRVDGTFRLSVRPAGAAAAALLATLTFSGCDSRPLAEPSVAASSKSSPPMLSPVRHVLDSESTSPRPFSTTGPLVADQQADVAAGRDGLVVRITAEIGDHVQKGQTLAMLDDRMLRADYESQKAKVASLAAQVKEWQSEQQVEEADLRRANALREDKILSDEDWEHVKYKLDETISEVDRYRADEAAAEAALELSRLQLEQSRVIAPFAGVVGRQSLRVAQEVKKGDVLFWVTAVEPLRILFTVPEAEMARFEKGAALELSTPDYPELRQAARIDRVSPVVDPASGSVQVIGEVVHPSRLLKPGMTMQVQAAVRTEARGGVTSAP